MRLFQGLLLGGLRLGSLHRDFLLQCLNAVENAVDWGGVWAEVWNSTGFSPGRAASLCVPLIGFSTQMAQKAPARSSQSGWSTIQPIEVGTIGLLHCEGSRAILAKAKCDALDDPIMTGKPCTAPFCRRFRRIALQVGGTNKFAGGLGRTIRRVERASIHLVVLFVFLHASNLAGQIVPPSVSQSRPAEITGIYIVTLRPGVSGSDRSALVQGAGATARVTFTKSNALSVEVPNVAVLARLRNDPRVQSVFANHLYYLPANGAAGPRAAAVQRTASQSGDAVTPNDITVAAAASSQVVPAGINRIGAAPGMLTWTGTGIGVAVVDTGLDFSHPDLDLNP